MCRDCGEDLPYAPSADDPYIGLLIQDKYAVEALIGEGAMGRVYKARQTTLKKPFAVKILAPHLMHDESSHARFAAEAHNCASLNHPNVVSVVDYGTQSGLAYIVMEFIEGRTLESIISSEFPLARERVVDLTLQVLAALTEAHGLGILHRDLKPENILVQSLRTHGELAKVLDFGIAKLMVGDSDDRPGLTRAGMVCGTPEYMSPEQARGRPLDARSDLYAVGAILYQMLAGRPPFESESAVEILHMHLHQEPIAPSKRRGVPPDPLEDVCLRALSKKAEDRFASALDFRKEILAAASVRRTDERPCARCGSAVSSEAKFCPSCGAPMTKRSSGTALRGSMQSGAAATVPQPRVEGESTAQVVVRGFPLPLVGRDAVVREIETQLDAPQPGLRARVLTGPAGIGKTRLCDEIAMRANKRGWRTLYAGADPSGARTPLWPIRTMVARLLDLAPTRVRVEDLGRAANLSGVAFEELPGLAELFGLPGPAFEAELAVRRRECFASAVQAMLSGGRDQPLLLVFDDVDGYDSASREVLRRLGQASATTPVYVVVATNEPELSWFRGSTTALPPLDAESIRQIGRHAIANVSPTSDLGERLAAIAPASPLALDHRLRLIAAGVEPPAHALDADLARLRIERVGPAAVRILQAAAVLGECTSDAALEAIVGTLDQRALEQLHADGLLVATAAGQRAFGHRSIYDIAYAGIEHGHRESLHALAANAENDPAAIVAKTLHTVRAGEATAIDRLAEAARYCERCFDDQSAADLANAAMRLNSARPDPKRRLLETELAVLASRTMRAVEQAPGAIAILQAEIGKGHAPIQEATLRCALAEQLVRVRRLDEALDALRKAVGSALAGGDPATLLHAYHELGKLYASRREHDKALAELREGFDMCTLGEGPRAMVDLPVWRYLMKIGDVHRQKGDLTEARTWTEHALFQAERRGDRLGILRAHAQMAWVLRDLKQMALAEQHLARALEEARSFGDRLTTAELLIERARARAARARLPEARRCCEEALRLARGIQWAAGIEHAERAITMLDRRVALPGASGPTEHSGVFRQPTAEKR